jgi:hypothetical protein
MKFLSLDGNPLYTISLTKIGALFFITPLAPLILRGGFRN